MKITCCRFSPRGEIRKEYVIEIKQRNQYVIQNVSDSITNATFDWYTVYDLPTLTYRRYNIADDSFIKKGKIRYGKWTVDQQVSTFEFMKYQQYMGYDGITFMEKIEGQFTAIQKEIHAVNNNLISKWIDPEFIYLIPISVTRMYGYEYENYGILAREYYHYPDKNRCLFEIKIHQ